MFEIQELNVIMFLLFFFLFCFVLLQFVPHFYFCVSDHVSYKYYRYEVSVRYVKLLVGLQ